MAACRWLLSLLLQLFPLTIPSLPSCKFNPLGRRRQHRTHTHTHQMNFARNTILLVGDEEGNSKIPARLNRVTATGLVLVGIVRGLADFVDEIFHVPQAQRYCQNKFSEWDSKITTFPGLYYVSTVFQRLLWMKECEPALLRAMSNPLADVEA
eukprot:scaffold428_cov168-Ochromonas_danica.AAC.36